MRLATPLQLLEEKYHDVKESDAAVSNRGVLIHQSAAQQTFQRAQQTALDAAEIGLHGFGAIQNGARLAGEKQCCGHLGALAVQRDDLQFPGSVHHCGSRVGRAEVNAQSQGRILLRQHAQSPAPGSGTLKCRQSRAGARHAPWGRYATAPHSPEQPAACANFHPVPRRPRGRVFRGP